MRLSPKTIFFGLVALGLPIAVTVGWQLAPPATRSAAVDAPGGAGAIGHAPIRVDRQAAAAAAPATSVASVPTATPSQSSAAPIVSSSAVVTTSPTPSAPPVEVPPTEASHGPLPPLTAPPVPTPTDPGSPDPTDSASAVPTDTPSAWPGDDWARHH